MMIVMINHPIGRFHISLHNFFAVDRDEGRVVRQLGVDVQPQVGQYVQVVKYMFDMCKTSKMFNLRELPAAVSSRRSLVRSELRTAPGTTCVKRTWLRF